MTDYPSNKRSKSSWRQAQIHKKWRDLAAIFIVAVLGIVLFSGVKSGFSFKGALQNSTWTGKVSLGVALKTDPPSILIYQKEPQNLHLYLIDSDVYYATGDASQPTKKVGDIYSGGGPKTTSLLTTLTGINISKYFFYARPKSASAQSANAFFKDFASPKTPFAVIFGNFESDQTNFTKLEILKLWWQVKGMELKQISVSDIGGYTDEVIGVKGENFNGLDYDKTSVQIGKLFHDFAEKNKKIEIINASGVTSSASLAQDLIVSYGWGVTNMKSEQQQDTTKILASQKENEAQDLAKIFGCDIFQAQNGQDKEVITIVLGKDFADKYF